MALFEYDDNKHYVLITTGPNDTLEISHTFGDDPEELIEALQGVIDVIGAENDGE